MRSASVIPRGELALDVVTGVQPEIWYFSVRDEVVAKQLSAAVGQRAQLHYAEHRGIPTSCFGETTYVDRVNTIDDASAGVAPVGAPPAAGRP